MIVESRKLNVESKGTVARKCSRFFVDYYRARTNICAKMVVRWMFGIEIVGNLYGNKWPI